MGQAKIKKAAQERINQLIKDVDFDRVATSVRKLALAASSHIGSDCYVHAVLAQEVLRRLGVTSQVVVGFAAWRVGDGGGDVIVHAPMPGMPIQPGGVPYHVWLEIGSYIFDTTAYQLIIKAAQLDGLDGGNTNVEWCPDYLFVHNATVSSLQTVTQREKGLYFYQREPLVECRVVAAASPLDADDAESVWHLYQNPDISVIGTNNLGRG